MMPLKTFLRALAAAALVLSARADMVVLQEIMHHPPGNQPEYFVLSNLTSTPLDIAHWKVSQGVHFDFPGFSKEQPQDALLKPFEAVVLSSADAPATRAAWPWTKSVRVFGPWTGKLSNDGERVTVQDKNGTVVCTAQYGTDLSPTPNVPKANGTGHALVLSRPNSSPTDRRAYTVGQLARSASSGDTNRVTASDFDEATSAHSSSSPQADVVINEIMCEPLAGDESAQYIELFNRGKSAQDLSHWRFTQGIHFRFPAGTLLPARGYLVVARNTNWMRQTYGSLSVVGNFEGSLAHRGEWLRLENASGNLVNEVDYRLGGAWPELAAGQGSSLELVNPWMDNSLPSAWRNSDESARASFHHYACTNLYLQSNAAGNPTDYLELHLNLVGPGYVVLRNVRLSHGSTNYVVHGTQLSTNGSGDSGWLCRGTHWASFVTNSELHLRADGRGDNRGNHVEIDLPGLQPNQTCELSFDARWVHGTPRLLAQTWDRSVGGSFLLEVPDALGTPGRANSRYTQTPAPQIDHLTHTPAVPTATDNIRVSAVVRSMSALESVQLFYRESRLTDDAVWQSARMQQTVSRQLDNSAVLYTGQIPASRDGVVWEFYVAAFAANGSTRAPKEASQHPALCVVDSRPLPRDLRTVRLVVAPGDLAALTNGASREATARFPRLSNHYFDATFISNEEEVHYGASLRQAGSPLTRSSQLRKVKFRLPADRPFRSRTHFSLDDDAAEPTAFHNRVARYLLYRLGHVVNENEFVRVVLNAGPIELRDDTEPVGKEFLKRNFARGNFGELYRIDDEWWFVDDGEGINQDARWAYTGTNANHYRQAWMKRTREREDDFSALAAFFKTISNSNSTDAEINAQLDTDAVLKLAAVRGFIGDWDNFTMQRGRNGYFYRRPSDGRFQLLHWDSDEGFITGPAFHGEFIRDLLERPANQAKFEAYLAELVRLCVREPEQLNAWLQAEREASAGASIFQANYAGFFKARATEVQQALGARTAMSTSRAARE